MKAASHPILVAPPGFPIQQASENPRAGLEELAKRLQEAAEDLKDQDQKGAQLALDEAGRMAAWGLPQFLFGMQGVTLVRTEATMPTCNVAALTLEPAGDFAGIPVAATVRIDFQLVVGETRETVTITPPPRRP